jgi:transcriptional regulator with XRE-family HTH domain
MAKSVLKRYRDAAGLSLAELAERFDVDKTTVMRWEDRRIPAERVVVIERVTGIPRSRLRPDLYRL